MSKLYAIRQIGKSNYWYDFVEDFTSSELDRNCVSNNFAYVKECQNNLGDLNPAWKNSEIVEFRELGEKDDFEDLYYKSLEQRADLEAKLTESERELEKQKEKYDHLYGCYKKTLGEDLKDKYRLAEENEKLKQQLSEKEAKLERISEINLYNKDLAETTLKQLAEKYTELSLARNEINTLKNNLNVSQEHDNIMCEQYFNKCKEINQDKISFAVEQLEKARELLFTAPYEFDSEEWCWVEHQISNQIADLTHQHEDKGE